MQRTFQLLAKLGEGAFGSVHLGEMHGEEGLVQTLAVKWLHPQFSGDRDLLRRLRDEARLLGLLHHDSIVRVHGLTHLEGRLAILMEPVDGVDLARVEDPVPTRAVLEIVEAVADALHAAHRTVPPDALQPLGVVHRDIKPSNIMITVRGMVKVMDFGVARASFLARETTTRSQQFGTAVYMAPERWLESVAEAPSDIFSLGVTAIELLTGESVQRFRLARDGFEADLDESIGRVDAPPEVRELVRQMCSYNATDRPDAHEVAARCKGLAEAWQGPSLRSWAEAWVPQHRSAAEQQSPTVVVEDLSDDTTPAPTWPTRITTGPPPRPSRIWPVAVVATMVLAFLAALATLDPPDEPDIVAQPLPEPVIVAPPMAGTARPPGTPAPETPPLQAPAPPALPATAALPTAIPGTAPTARPAPRATAPTPPEPPAAEIPAPVARPETSITFVLDPPGLSASTPLGAIVHRKAVRVPQNQLLPIRVGDGEVRCSVLVETAPATWRVDARGCTRVQ